MNEIKLPPLPRDVPYQESVLVAYARAAVELDRQSRSVAEPDTNKGNIVGWLRRRSDPDGACTIPGTLAGEIADHIEALTTQSFDGWKEATIAWSVCRSVHEKFCKGKDALYSTRHSDFQKHEDDARATVNAPEKK